MLAARAAHEGTVAPEAKQPMTVVPASSDAIFFWPDAAQVAVALVQAAITAPFEVNKGDGYACPTSASTGHRTPGAAHASMVPEKPAVEYIGTE